MDNKNDDFSNPFDQDPPFNSPSVIENDSMRPIEDDTSGRTFVWLILGVVAVGCGIIFAAALFFFKPNAQALVDQYFPSPTATFTRTPTVTPTPTPTSTLTPTPTLNMTATAAAAKATNTALAYQTNAANAAATGRIILQDAFDSNKNNWLTKQSDDEYALTSYEISNGNYTWDATAHKPFIGWVTASSKSVGDFYLSVEIKQTAGPDSADYGVLFHEDSNSNFYYFGINDRGFYSLYLYNQDWIALIDWTESEFIRPGESNRITVIAEGSHFIFFLNDQYLADITDDTIKSGKTSLAIELAAENDNAVIQFDNFELRVPK